MSSSSLNDDGTVIAFSFPRLLFRQRVKRHLSERFRNLSQRHAHAANFWKCNDLKQSIVWSRALDDKSRSTR